MNAAFRRILAVNQTGSVKSILSKHDAKVNIGEGAQGYLIKPMDSPTSKPYYGKTTDIALPMTNANIDCAEWHKSFFTLEYEITLTFPKGHPLIAKRPQFTSSPGLNVAYTDDLIVALLKSMYIWFGFKAATDGISQYKVTHNGIDVANTTVQQQQIESFLMNVMKPKSEWQNKSGTMTLWEDAWNHDTSVCGKYVSLFDLYAEIAASGTYRLNFHTQVLFDMFSMWQSVELMPLCLGEWSLVVQVSADALCWCCVNPEVTIREACEQGTTYQDPVLLYQAAKNIYPFQTDCYYERRFTQVQQMGRTFTVLFPVNGGDWWSYSYADMQVSVQDVMCKQAWSTVCGFKMSREANLTLRDYYATNPMVLTGDYIRWYRFSTPPTEAGLNCVISLPMFNVIQIFLLFPKLGSDLVCFDNPMLRDIQLRFCDRIFPERGGTQTNFLDFYRIQLEADNLDGWLEPTESFENSMVRPSYVDSPYRCRSMSDNTCFVMNVRCGRDSASAFCDDGITSNQETLTLTAAPIFNDDRNTYLLLNQHNTLNVENPTREINGTPPIIALNSPSVWFITSSRPPIYETSARYNESFARNFPELFRSLTSDAGVHPSQVL
jgi:hypothetical protein